MSGMACCLNPEPWLVRLQVEDQRSPVDRRWSPPKPLMHALNPTGTNANPGFAILDIGGAVARALLHRLLLLSTPSLYIARADHAVPNS